MKTVKKIDLFCEAEGLDWETFEEILKSVLMLESSKDETEFTAQDLVDLLDATSEDNNEDLAELLAKTYDVDIWHWYERELTARTEYINNFVENFGIDTDKFDFWTLLREAHISYICDQIQKLHEAVKKIVARQERR